MMGNIQLPEIMLIGITARTNNQSEMDPAQSTIGSLVQEYFQDGLFNQIPERINQGVTYSVYTDYESDHTGDYTYFIGEAVSSIDALPEGFTAITIPDQSYQKFTSESGPMPDVCLNLWQDIWSNQELAARRAYQADFEIYDQRAMDPNHTVLDIYIGVK
jgi:predicted transcriptional regulator YdeE